MENLYQFFLVRLGGAIGSIARWQLSGVILRQAFDWRFPLGTFTVKMSRPSAKSTKVLENL